MKILSISLSNLNSLRGNWNINLEDSVYTSGGMFAVTGSTGAGKTTIFDAVCLALYGKTPRLGKIEGQTNEIMSKHTDNCMAKVKFESGGKIYICEWLQDRVKGRLQTKHTISHDGKTLNESGKQSETLELVVKITGMDFDRFVQAVLLEQGKFDTFLNANKNKRAEVLELITGTGIYSRISSHVYYRNKKERESLDAKRKELESEKSRFEGMTADNLQSEISRKENEISRAEAKHNSTKEILSWQREIIKLNNDIAGIKQALRLHEQSIAIFEAERAILDSAERAMSLDGEYSMLRAKREAKIKTHNDISALSAKISSQEAEYSRIAGEIPRLADELSRLKGDITVSPDAVTAGIEAAVKNYDDLKNDFAGAERASLRAERECVSAKKNLELIEAQGKKLSEECRELDDRRRTLHDQFMSMDAKTREAVLDEARGTLKDGVPCPVCGSLTHPVTAHKDSSGENPDILFAVKAKLNEDCRRAEEAFRIADKKLQDERDKWQAAYAEKISAFKEYSRLIEELSARKSKLSEAKAEITDSIRRIGISWDDDTRKIIRLAREWSAKIDTLEKHIQSSQQEMNRIHAVTASDSESLDVKRNEIRNMSEELDGLETAFSEKLREKNFSDELEFSEARSHSGQIEELRIKRDALSAKSAMLNGALNNIQEQLDEKSAMNLTQESPEKIEALHRAEEAGLKILHRDMGILTQKLSGAKDSAERVKTLEGEYDALKTSCDDWALLNDLIGSAAGDKFRVYAQKVTLSLVVNNANDYLQKMNGRYTLILTPDNDNLELSVKDNEQAGIIRPTENLSGGEKFIISLALALGLSQISGSKAQVDSLFIDEGFGSLDEDSLNAALDALGEIRREGRMIGIISHVHGISERIPAKISVIRQSEGTSIITGPGCSGRISNS